MPSGERGSAPSAPRGRWLASISYDPKDGIQVGGRMCEMTQVETTGFETIAHGVGEMKKCWKTKFFAGGEA